MPGQKILIIDDDLNLVNVLIEYLQKNTYKVISLNSGKDAMKTIRDEQPDLILLDIILPDTNGYDICYELKRGSQAIPIPVIMLTGKPGWKDEIEGMSKLVKADDDLCKPFDLKVLLEKIKKLLNE